tara:strand:- start:118 stop:852 length:735 start_codon:yes stop_codon:yes gene_type:complete
MNNYIFNSLAETYVIKNKKKKFKETCWRVILYSISVLYIYNSYKNNNIEFSRESIWKDWPHEITNDTYNIYKYYISLYIHQLFLINIESKNTDYISLLIHHFITLILVILSWYNNFTKIGIFIMGLHDISDVFLEIAKCFNYLKSSKLSKGADIFFIIFSISFFYLRLYIFPTIILPSVMYDSCNNKNIQIIEPYCFFSIYYNIFNSLLLSLQILQIYWGYKIVNVIYNSILGKKLEDPRDIND